MRRPSSPPLANNEPSCENARVLIELVLVGHYSVWQVRVLACGSRLLVAASHTDCRTGVTLNAPRINQILFDMHGAHGRGASQLTDSCGKVLTRTCYINLLSHITYYYACAMHCHFPIHAFRYFIVYFSDKYTTLDHGRDRGCGRCQRRRTRCCCWRCRHRCALSHPRYRYCCRPD